MTKVSKIITVNGLVQGIGFRPFVDRLARQFHLGGEVRNDHEGVRIFVTGYPAQIDDFYDRLVKYPYNIARISRIGIASVPLTEFTSFKIVESRRDSGINLPLTPDMAICETCASELSDPTDRRYNYPFISCVSCGQRWAVTTDYPFDREHTSYEDHPMCDACTAEYTDPDNRRYHAQTLSCPVCGFRSSLIDRSGNMLTDSATVFRVAAERMDKGEILAVKNTSGYLLCCDAGNAALIRTLRERKHRPKKPFAVLFPDEKTMTEVVELYTGEVEMLQSRYAPIVLARLKRSGKHDLAIGEISPGLDTLGVMLPYSGILKLLSAAYGKPMIATSGNPHGHPVIADEALAEVSLAGIADSFLHHNQKVVNAQDDSVVRYSEKYHKRIIIRRSRGMAPDLSRISADTRTGIIALGASLKSTVALKPNQYIYISQYIGNFDNLECYDRFDEVTHKFLALFNMRPEVILIDKHPQYLNRSMAEDLSRTYGGHVLEVQHHKAHFAAILGEEDLFESDRRILGVIWDGTGYGDDGNIWGGEFLIYDEHEIHRFTHWKYYNWIAADKMSREPRLSLFSLSYPEREQTLKEKFSDEEWQIYTSLLSSNKMKTSSTGRIFDAVASVLGICDHNSFEGEAAMLLEALACKSDRKNPVSYLDVVQMNADFPDPSILIENIYKALEAAERVEDIAFNFLYTLSDLIISIARRAETDRVALSGGVFQNALLIDLLIDMADDDMQIILHKELSANDENISYGQLMYYLNCKEHYA